MCILAQNNIKFIKNPVFAIQSQYDSLQVSGFFDKIGGEYPVEDVNSWG